MKKHKMTNHENREQTDGDSRASCDVSCVGSVSGNPLIWWNNIWRITEKSLDKIKKKKYKISSVYCVPHSSVITFKDLNNAFVAIQLKWGHCASKQEVIPVEHAAWDEDILSYMKATTADELTSFGQRETAQAIHSLF